MPEPRVAHALFCDEIRSEANGRLNYVGVRNGDISVSTERLGGMLSFAVVAWLICDPDDVPPLITLRVYGPPGRQLFTANEVKPAPPPRRPDSTKAFFQLSIERIDLPLRQEGDIEVSIETDAGILRAGRLRLRFDSSAQLHPAAG